MSAQAEKFTSPRAASSPATGAHRGELEDELTRYDFRGRTLLGDHVNYYIYAHDEDGARRQLTEARIFVDEVTPHLSPRRGQRKFKREDLGAFCLQLSDRIKAGESMAGAALELARASRHNLLREALLDVTAELRREGARPADAFRVRPDVFPAAFANLIGIGARKGDISDVLTKYGAAQLRTAENISKFKSALYYPLTIMALAAVVVAVMCYFILPKMQEFYTTLLPLSQGQLPWLTRLLLGASRFLTSVPGLLVLFLAAALVAYLAHWCRHEGREDLERASLRWPGVGAVLRSFHAAYTIHLISILVGAGITPNEFLREAAESSINIVYREKLLAIREAFHEGGLDLQTAFAPYAFLFGDGFQITLATGEKTGRLDAQLAAYAQLLDRRVQETITRLSKLIEPATLIVAGIVIGLIVVAAYLPLFTLIGQLANTAR